MKRVVRLKFKRFALSIVVLLIIAFVAACSKNDSSDTVSAEPSVYFRNENVTTESEVMSYDYDASDVSGGGAFVPGAAPASGAGQTALMFIKKVNINLITDTFEKDIDMIRSIVISCDGFFESSNLYIPNSQNPKDRKRYTATIRIPVSLYEYAKEAFENTGKLIASTEITEEVSAQYFNTQSRLTTLKVEEERLLELIDEAYELKLLIQLEQRLSETRTQIQMYEYELIRLESETSYSTITLNVQEAASDEMIPTEKPDDTFLSRLEEGFKSSLSATSAFLQNVIVFLAYIAAPAVFVLFVYVCCRIVFKRKAKKAVVKIES